MPRNLPPAALAAMMAPETTLATLYLLTITTTISGVLYYTNNATDITSTLGGAIPATVFLHLPFDIILAPNEEGKVTGAQLSIDNVERRLIDDIRREPNALPVRVDIVSTLDVDEVIASFPDTVMRNVAYNELTISGELVTENLMIENFSKLMTGKDYPALFVTR